jgi:hypothetical protein
LFKQLRPQWDRLVAEMNGEEVPVVQQPQPQQQTPQAEAADQANVLAWDDDEAPVPFPPSVDIDEFVADAAPVTWFLEDVLPDRAIIQFNGRYKHGKTLWLCDLLRAAGKGRTEWCGKKLDPGPVLIVSQEGKTVWKKRREKFGLQKKLVRFKTGFGGPRPYYGRPKFHVWKSLIFDLMNEVLKHDLRLVVFDIITDFWPVQNHLDTGEINEAITALRLITEHTPASVLLFGHLNQQGQHKGNNETLGAADVVVKFGLPTSKSHARNGKRKLNVQGRFIDTEYDLFIKRTEAGYVLDKAPAAKDSEDTEDTEDATVTPARPAGNKTCKMGDKDKAILKELVNSHPGAKTTPELEQATGIKRKTLTDRLDRLRENCRFVFVKLGKAGEATTYTASDRLMAEVRSTQAA